MIKFKIVTPERILYEDEVDQVTLPTPKGEITILPHHIPLVSLLSPGEIRVVKNKEEVSMATSGGFVEIAGKNITLLADTAERAEEIDEERAAEAEKRAKELMAEKKLDSTEFAYLTAKIEKELARLKVVRRRKHRDLNRPQT